MQCAEGQAKVAWIEAVRASRWVWCVDEAERGIDVCVGYRK
jgi:hypothetical protein